MNKADKLKFKKLMLAMLKDCGAIIGENFDPITMETRCGKLSIHLFDEAEYRKFSPWVATRFDDRDKAFKVLGREINPYSGKWNHHFPGSWKPEFCVDEMKRQLSRIAI